MPPRYAPRYSRGRPQGRPYRRRTPVSRRQPRQAPRIAAARGAPQLHPVSSRQFPVDIGQHSMVQMPAASAGSTVCVGRNGHVRANQQPHVGAVAYDPPIAAALAGGATCRCSGVLFQMHLEAGHPLYKWEIYLDKSGDAGGPEVADLLLSGLVPATGHVRKYVSFAGINRTDGIDHGAYNPQLPVIGTAKCYFRLLALRVDNVNDRFVGRLEVTVYYQVRA